MIFGRKISFDLRGGPLCPNLELRSFDMRNIYAIQGEFFEVMTLARIGNFRLAAATPNRLWSLIILFHGLLLPESCAGVREDAGEDASNEDLPCFPTSSLVLSHLWPLLPPASSPRP